MDLLTLGQLALPELMTTCSFAQAGPLTSVTSEVQGVKNTSLHAVDAPEKVIFRHADSSMSSAASMLTVFRC